MRKGFAGLCGDVRQVLELDPLSGHLFLFRNRRRDRIKILLWDGDGFAIYYKRLERGTFELPQAIENDGKIEIRASELAMILDGIRLEGRTRRERFELAAAES
jgi:transposase